MDKSVREHLGFEDMAIVELKCINRTDEYTESYIGEFKSNDATQMSQFNGRGIALLNWTGRIEIGNFEKQKLSTGTYIKISASEEFTVGEKYLNKYGEKKERFTNYNKNCAP